MQFTIENKKLFPFNKIPSLGTWILYVHLTQAV